MKRMRGGTKGYWSSSSIATRNKPPSYGVSLGPGTAPVSVCRLSPTTSTAMASTKED